jgi:ferric enterobactin receptor
MATRNAVRVHRIIAIFFFSSIVFAFSQSSPADKKISLRSKNEPIRRILKSLSDQTGIGFVFQDDLVKGHTVSCDVDSLPLDLALDNILSPVGISFKRMQDGPVVLYDDKTTDRLVRGWVIDASNGNGLPNANIIQEGTSIGTTSDDEGRFTLQSNDPNPCTIRVSYIGYHPEQVRVHTGEKPDSLKIPMREKPLKAKAVTVECDRVPDLELAGKNGRMSFVPEKMDFIPSAGGNNFERTLQLLPGIGGAYDRPGQLSIYGGLENETLVTLDGIPLYQPGTYYGFLGPFHPRTVENVTVWKGAFPAHLGDVLSGIVELTGNTVPENRFNAGAGVDMFSSNAFIELPIHPKLHLFLAGRISHPDITNGPYYRKINDYLFLKYPRLKGDPWDYSREPMRQQTDPTSVGFQDFTAKITLSLFRQDLLSLSFLTRRENSRLKTSFLYPPYSSNESSSRYRFDNCGLSFGWNHAWNRSLESGLLLVDSKNLTDNNFGLGYFEDHSFRERKIQWDNRYQTRWTALRLGIEFTRRDREREINDWRAGTGATVHLFKNNANYRTLYAEGSLSPLEGFELSCGVRTTHISAVYPVLKKYPQVLPSGAFETVFYLEPEEQDALDPRISAAYSIGKNLNIGASWGRRRQFVYNLWDDENPNMAGSGIPYVFTPPELYDGFQPPRVAEQSLVHIRYATGLYSVVMGGYYKFYPDMVWEPSALEGGPYQEGEGFSKGIEWIAEKKKGIWTGWVSYRLGWTNYRFYGTGHQLDSEWSRPPSIDRRHEIKGAVEWRIGTVRISLAGVLASGKPHPLSGTRGFINPDGSGSSDWTYTDRLPWNGTRLPAYERTDLQITKKFTKRLGVNWEISASILNLFDHDNVWFRKYDNHIHGVNYPPGKFVMLDDVPLDVPMLGFTPMASISVELR